MESSPLLSNSDKEKVSYISDDDFRRQSYILIACLFLTTAVIGYVATLSIILAWIMGFIAFCIVLYTLFVIRGVSIWMRGSLPLVKEKEAKYIEVQPNKRVVEYFVWGSEEEDATPLVALHGSGTTGKYFHQHLFPDEALKRMNVKVISPSFPGHGGSDVQRCRRITNWPSSDLEPILKEENVDKFLVIGSSYGTAHAMATASAIPDRCLAMGLNAPYLPEKICREAGLWTDADMILREEQLVKPWIHLPVLCFLSLIQGFVASGIKAYPEGKQAFKECPDLINALMADTDRCFMRGVNGQAYEMLDAETTQSWPDPREIKVKNIAVWYGNDDGIVPPAHGKWLAENIATKTNNGKLERNLNVKNEEKGLGHFTYMSPDYCETGVMTQALLDMISLSKS